MSSPRCRVSVDELEVAVPYEEGFPVATVDADPLGGPMDFWARSRERAVVVVADESAEGGPSVDCAEATESGGVARLPLRPGARGVRVYVTTRFGDRGSYVAGLVARGAPAPERALGPYPPMGLREAAVWWTIREVPCREGNPCAEETLHVEGAFALQWSRPVEMARSDCLAWSDDGPSNGFGFQCGSSLWRTVTLHREGRSAVLREQEGGDASEGGRARVMHRVALPEGVRLVPRGAGVLALEGAR